jgi:hypothetical protein
MIIFRLFVHFFVKVGGIFFHAVGKDVVAELGGGVFLDVRFDLGPVISVVPHVFAV